MPRHEELYEAGRSEAMFEQAKAEIRDAVASESRGLVAVVAADAVPDLTDSTETPLGTYVSIDTSTKFMAAFVDLSDLQILALLLSVRMRIEREINTYARRAGVVALTGYEERMGE